MPLNSLKNHFNQTVKIGTKLIGPGQPCFIIAEAGSNHNQDLNNAKKMIDVASIAKADVVKFQTFIPSKIYVQDAGFADYLGQEKSIQEIFEKISMPREWILELSNHCKLKNILFMSSAFDEESCDLIDPFVEAHKIASYECTHLPLVKHIASKGKPVIMSVAMATMDEIQEALETIASTGNKNVILMHCIAKYPHPITSSNLLVIDTLREAFNVPVGLSDHTREALFNPIIVVARGGNILEKHFTLSNEMQGPDQKFSVEPNELIDIVKSVRLTENALGSPIKQLLSIEEELYNFARRHIHAIKAIKKGEIFTRQNIDILRSGKIKHGLEPKYFDEVIGKHAARDILPSQGIERDDIQ